MDHNPAQRPARQKKNAHGHVHPSLHPQPRTNSRIQHSSPTRTPPPPLDIPLDQEYCSLCCDNFLKHKEIHKLKCDCHFVCKNCKITNKDECEICNLVSKDISFRKVK